MPSITAAAPGKIILFGEHAVVYGRPAIAIPVTQVQARATVSPNPRASPGAVRIQAPAIGLDTNLEALSESHPLAVVVNLVVATLGISHLPACTIRVTSTIPVAAGLGSGAAVSVALARALSAFLGRPLPDDKVSAIAYEAEKIHHGSPSGIDNTVITYARPVYFVKGYPIEMIGVKQSFTLVIGDTGIASPTKVAVADVRQGWIANPSYFESLFDAITQVTQAARQAIEEGRIKDLGPLMDTNHELLIRLGVSCSELDHLVQAARSAGALGAKLSGGGRGGNMIALCHSGDAMKVSKALKAAGATRIIITEVREAITQNLERPRP